MHIQATLNQENLLRMVTLPSRHLIHGYFVYYNYNLSMRYSWLESKKAISHPLDGLFMVKLIYIYIAIRHLKLCIVAATYNSGCIDNASQNALLGYFYDFVVLVYFVSDGYPTCQMSSQPNESDLYLQTD